MKIEISRGARDMGVVRPIALDWSEFADSVRQPTRDHTTVAQYNSASKQERGKLKAKAGFFAAGPFGGDAVSSITRGGRNGKAEYQFALQEGEFPREDERLAVKWMITLDFDEITDHDLFERVFTRRDIGLKCAAIAHTTRSDTPQARRFRILAPLSRAVTRDEHIKVTRHIARLLDPDLTQLDPVSDKWNQVMYCPSASSDGSYTFVEFEGDAIDPDPILKVTKETSRDRIDGIAYLEGDEPEVAPKKKRKSSNADDGIFVTGNWSVETLEICGGDPRGIPGAAGAFNRAYRPWDAMEKFLPDVYERDGNRFTYVEGSSSRGVAFPDPLYAYSHHSTDPFGGRAMTAFDVVRLHKFAHLDHGSSNVPYHQLNSYKQMERLLMNDKPTVDEMQKHQNPEITAEDFDFAEFQSEQAPLDQPQASDPGEAASFDDLIKAYDSPSADEAGADIDVAIELDAKREDTIEAGDNVGVPDEDETDREDVDLESMLVEKFVKGKPAGFEPSLENVVNILINDHRLRDRIGFNELTNQDCFVDHVDFDTVNVPDVNVSRNGFEAITERHVAHIMTWLGTRQNRGGWEMNVPRGVVEAAIQTAADKNKFHPFKRLLSAEEWDGKERLDTLFIDYLGTPDNVYYREIARKTVLAMIFRTFEPGCDFQNLLVVEGGQRAGKSDFLKTLSGGFFNEIEASDMRDVQRKTEAFSTAVMVESPELTAFKALPDEEAKQLISRSFYYGRGAYERSSRWTPLRCVIVGTTNKTTYLSDPTGNLRYWPCRISKDLGSKSQIENDRLQSELPQIYAEALANYLKFRSENPIARPPLRLSPEAEDIQLELTNVARVENDEDSIAGRIEQLLTTPIGTPDQNPELLAGRAEQFYEVIDGQIYRKIWCRIQIINDLIGQDESMKSLAATRGKANPFAKAIDNIPWINPGKTSNRIHGVEELGPQRYLHIDMDIFRDVLARTE